MDTEKGKEKSSKEKIKELKEKIERCEGEKSEYLAGWQRARADYLNFKKNEIERIEEIIKNANEELILKILPILDNLELAEANLSNSSRESDYIKGVLQIKKQFLDILKREGVEEIKTIGERFDPNFHDVVEEIEKKGVDAGIIIKEIQKGYTLNGKVIRPSKVRVSK